MTTLGIIRNPSSRRNRGNPTPGIDRLAGAPLLREPRSHAELDSVLAEFAARDVGMIAIDGGDGTVRDVVTAAATRFDRLPAFALLSSGRTNVIAEDAGSWGHGPAALAQLAGAAAADCSGRPGRERATLAVVHGGRLRLGFVFGAAAFRRGTALSTGGGSAGLGHRLSTGAAIVRALASATAGRGRRDWLAGTPMAIAHDGAEAGRDASPRFIFLATTLQRFMLGVFPFWGDATQAIRYLDVAAPAPRLTSALLPVLRGRPKPWMAGAGYRSGSSSSIRLVLDEPFILDGEEYSPGETGAVTIEAGPTVRFVSP